MQRLDRVLNIVLIVVVALYLIGKFGASEEDKALELTSSAEKEFTGAPSDSVATPASITIKNGMQPYDNAALQSIIHQSDQPVLVLTFASWCPYCKKLFPDFVAVAKEMQPNLTVAAVSLDEEPEKLEAFLQQYPGLEFPVYNASTADERDAFKALLASKSAPYSGGIPYTVLFKDGEAKEQVPGAVPKETLRSLVEKYVSLIPSAFKSV